MSLSAAHPDASADELQIRNISKRFGDVQVLRDISFTVRHGEFVTLLGPSGCGKTTLLRIIAGLELAEAGQVILCSQRLGDLPANRRPVNTVFQNYALFPYLTVFENIAFGLRARGVAGTHVNDRVAGAARMLQLDPLLQRHPHQLSGGQKQRVALARALVNEPELLLLDEPMSALDAKLRAEVQLDLRRLQRQLGKTFLLVTHDQDEAMTVSDRILVMRDGQIEQSGTPSEVYEHPVSRFVAEFLGSANLIPATRCDGHVQTALGNLVTRTAPAWSSGHLAIRPERVGVSRAPVSVNGVRATVRETIYRGDHLDLFVEPANFRVRLAPTWRLEAGETIYLELSPQHLEVLRD